MSEIDILLNHNESYRKLKEEELKKAKVAMEKEQKSKSRNRSYKERHMY